MYLYALGAGVRCCDYSPRSERGAVWSLFIVAESLPLCGFCFVGNRENASQMGNSNPKPAKLSKLPDKKWHSTQSQFSTLSTLSAQSSYSHQSRTWSRASRNSRRQRKHSTKLDRYDATKTNWPVSITEAMFLPEFPIKGEVDESSFEIEGLVARGAFGKVVKVRKKDSGVTYVMKVLSKSRIILENAVQQCKDEALIQVTCGQHPFIVNCLHFWQSKKHLFLVIDYVPDGELLELWKQYATFPEDVVLIFIAELAITLDYLHNAGVMHRDLKMENILLDKDGHVQLIDFGLSKWLQMGSRARTICGTIQYMAPEILWMDTYTHAADWWSLGVILYCLLMGHYPVDGIREHTEMAEAVMKFDFTMSSHVSEEVRVLANKLLCKDPSRRLQSLRQLRWEPCFSGMDFDQVKAKQISPRKLLDKSLLMKSLEENCKLLNSSLLVTIPRNSENDISQLTEMFEDFAWVSAPEIF